MCKRACKRLNKRSRMSNETKIEIGECGWWWGGLESRITKKRNQMNESNGGGRKKVRI